MRHTIRRSLAGLTAAALLAWPAQVAMATDEAPSAYPGCTPTEGREATPAIGEPTVTIPNPDYVPATEAQGPETIDAPNPAHIPAQPAQGEPTIVVTVPNPAYQPAWDETVITGTLYRHSVLFWETKVFPPNANPHGWVKVRDVTEVVHHDAVGSPTIEQEQPNPAYVPATEAVGPETISVPNPDYVPAAPAQGEPTVTVPNPEYVPAQDAVLADTCETVTFSWVMPDGGTPDNVTWPQTLAEDDACDAWLQVDTYRHGTAEQQATVAAIIADGVLTGPDEDGPVYLSHQFAWAGDCEPEPQPEPEPETPTVPETPVTPVTPVVPATPVEPAAAPLAAVQPLQAPVEQVTAPEPLERRLAVTGAEPWAIALLAVTILAVGAGLLAAARKTRRKA